MRDLEIGEFFKIGEFKVSNTAHSFTDCSVEGNDSAMDTGVSDGEEVDDVLSIARELKYSVWEGKDSRSDRPVPGDSPVPTVLDNFSGFNSSEGDFEVPKLFDFGVILGSG